MLRSITSDFPGCWDGLIVLCAANNLDGVRLADQHIAERLCEIRPVLYVDPPRSLITRFRKNNVQRCLQEPKLRVVRSGLARLSPVVQPFFTRTAMVPLTNMLLSRLIPKAVSRLTNNVAAVVSAWPMHPVLGRCGERAKIYWAQDDFVGGASLLGMDASRLLAGEQRSAREADAIIAANPTVADTWRNRGYMPWLIPYGVDASAYSGNEILPRPRDIRLSGPIAGFVGHINERIDLVYLEAVASAGMSLLLIGPRARTTETERWKRLLNMPNVQWLGPKPFPDLPPYFQAIDVGMVPYGDSAFNIGSFPLKTLEYLAAGLPVVSTDLPASRWLDTPLVTIAATPGIFSESVSSWVHASRDPAIVAQRRAFARRHDWSHRVEAMIDVIDQLANGLHRHCA